MLALFCVLTPTEHGDTWSLLSGLILYWQENRTLTIRQRFCWFIILVYSFVMKSVSQSIQHFDMYCFFQSKTSLESASKMDLKASLTHCKLMTPSTNSSGLIASGRLKKKLRVQEKLECWAQKHVLFCHQMEAEYPREKPWLSKWTNLTVSQTVVWTPVRSASTVNVWNRQTLVKMKNK